MSGRAASRLLVSSLEAASIVVLGIALVWWGIVFAQVMLNTSLAASGALPCLLYVSDRCSLAMALCGEWHVLGIKRYFAEILWAGAGLGLAALILGALPAFPSTLNEDD